MFPDRYRWSELNSRASLACVCVARCWKWNCLFYNRFEEYNGVEVNSAKIPNPKDVLFKGPRFEWNLWNRFLMNEISSYALQDFIFKYRRILNYNGVSVTVSGILYPRKKYLKLNTVQTFFKKEIIYIIIIINNSVLYYYHWL